MWEQVNAGGEGEGIGLEAAALFPGTSRSRPAVRSIYASAAMSSGACVGEGLRCRAAPPFQIRVRPPQSSQGAGRPADRSGSLKGFGDRPLRPFAASNGFLDAGIRCGGCGKPSAMGGSDQMPGVQRRALGKTNFSDDDLLYKMPLKTVSVCCPLTLPASSIADATGFPHLAETPPEQLQILSALIAYIAVENLRYTFEAFATDLS